MHTTFADICVVGAGLIGLSVALELRSRGLSVEVVDNNCHGSASSAAGGMLAPLSESGDLNEAVALGTASLQMYNAFLAQLRDITGETIQTLGIGTLRVPDNYSDSTPLIDTFNRQKVGPLDIKLIDGSAAREIEPLLSPLVSMAVYSADERQVDPVHLLEMCRSAAVASGIVISYGTCRILRDSSTGCEVETDTNSIACRTVVVCAGAWLPRLIGLPEKTLQPVKGQIGAIQQRGLMMSGVTIYQRSTYLIPRAFGRIVVGATEEPNSGFSIDLTDDAEQSLLTGARTLVPGIKNARLTDHWSGIRPVSFDGAPLLGPVAGRENILIAGGHGRNGVLLTPITGKIVSDFIIDGIPIPKSFDSNRLVNTLNQETACPN